MPGEKHFTKKRSAGYFNQLLQDNPTKLITKYAICPSSDIEGYLGNSVLNNIDPSSYSPRTVNLTYAQIRGDRKVGYINLLKTPRVGVGTAGFANEGGDAIVFDASYDDTNGGVPVYFLPWNAGGAVVRLRIPTKGTNVPDPDVFFTAAINGCSVFIQGNPDNPTVYHAGGDTAEADPNSGARFWRRTLLNLLRTRPYLAGSGSVVAEVNKTEYVKSPGVPGGTTMRAAEYEAYLKGKLDKAGKFTVTMVNPWGCVLGLRTGNNWKFYLQENGTVVCNIVTKQGVKQRSYARPMVVKEIYPGGRSHIADMRWKVPAKIS